MDPLAYLLSWTTYGTWLHGDNRGWVESGEPGVKAPDPNRLDDSRQRMTSAAIRLDPGQRQLVETTIRDHCQIRKWTLHAVNVRTNHIHVVVTAEMAPEKVMEQFKAWCSRRLSEAAGLVPAPDTKNGKRRWWTEHGSTKWINDEDYFHNAVRYVNERQ